MQAQFVTSYWRSKATKPSTEFSRWGVFLAAKDGGDIYTSSKNVQLQQHEKLEKTPINTKTKYSLSNFSDIKKMALDG